MSWSIDPEIKAMPIAEAVEAVEKKNMPEPIKQYIIDGIDALCIKHGSETKVTVVGWGHLCDGKDYDVTSATIDVRKAD